MPIRILIENIAQMMKLWNNSLEEVRNLDTVELSPKRQGFLLSRPFWYSWSETDYSVSV